MAFYPTAASESISLEQLCNLGSIYSQMVETLDTLQFSAEHRDWREATKAYRIFTGHNAQLMEFTGESLALDLPDFESLSYTTESGLVEAVSTFIDKIPALIIKIAVGLIGIITAAILYFKKKSVKGGKLDTTEPLSVKGYMDTTEDAYLARYHKTEQMITKLIGILDSHVKGDLAGIASRVREAQVELDNITKLIKNPTLNLVTRGKERLSQANATKLAKAYKRNLESGLGSLHGLYPTHLHENIGVLVIDPNSRSVDSSLLSFITDTHRVEDTVRHLKNATVDTLLSKFLINVSLDVSRASSITISPNKVSELNSLIERTNHATSGLIDKFESSVGEVKQHVESIKKLGEQLESMSMGAKHKAPLKVILDEVNLASKDITTYVREIQSLLLHLVIKY